MFTTTADSSVVNYVVIAKEQEQIKFIPGDIDNDERVNAFDIILMRRDAACPYRASNR